MVVRGLIRRASMAAPTTGGTTRRERGAGYAAGLGCLICAQRSSKLNALKDGLFSL